MPCCAPTPRWNWLRFIDSPVLVEVIGVPPVIGSRSTLSVLSGDIGRRCVRFQKARNVAADIVAIPKKRATTRPKLVHQFLVALSGTDPLVWRRIQVPERYSF
jgi:hypothetical protein